MNKPVVLTGIKPTGMPHLGNYLGAIRPALKLGEAYEARFFIADYHSLNGVKDPQVLRNSIYEVAASWLASGLDPQKMLLYKQSDIPEIFELAVILAAFTAKGLMNRAHAYKAAVDVNKQKGKPEDHQINMGLYTYPVLMAADILLFNTNLVPVGKDQVQHVEMAQDIAAALNHNYKEELLVIPQAVTGEEVMTVPGLDGRKMSKSYENHIPLFVPPKKLRKLINKIVTNSQEVEEPKAPETCTIFKLYKIFAHPQEQEALAARYRQGGMGWGEAKTALFEKLDAELEERRNRYDALMADKEQIHAILTAGAAKARKVAGETIRRLRKALGVD